MNDRIKLLAEQANIRFGRMAILDGDPRGMARFVSYSEFEKFADLILFECIKLAVFKGDTATAQAIKEHFEVK